MVAIKNDGRNLRLCAASSTALDASLDVHYPLPLPRELFLRQSRGPSFSKTHLKEAVAQILLE